MLNIDCLTFVNLTFVNKFTFVIMDINERFMLVVDKVSNSRSAFAKTTGISAVILSHISSGRNKVGLAPIIQMLESFPMVNVEYILLGKGEPFKQSKNEKWIELAESLKAIKQAMNSNQQRISVQLESLINQITTD